LLLGRQEGVRLLQGRLQGGSPLGQRCGGLAAGRSGGRRLPLEGQQLLAAACLAMPP